MFLKNSIIVRLLLVILITVQPSMLIVGCDGQKSVNSQSTSPISVINDPLLARVDSLLNKDSASDRDVEFVMSLSPEEIGKITLYYEQNPRIKPDLGDEIKDDFESSLATDSWAGETIECGNGFGGWVASSWMHTTACGGDGDDHFYFYPGVPGAYAYRANLRGRSVHPAVLIVLASYGWKLSARVYPSNNVYICVGSRMHAFGLTHEAWRTSFNFYRVG
jgi:hypothetical protein